MQDASQALVQQARAIAGDERAAALDDESQVGCVLRGKVVLRREWPLQSRIDAIHGDPEVSEEPQPIAGGIAYGNLGSTA